MLHHRVPSRRGGGRGSPGRSPVCALVAKSLGVQLEEVSVAPASIDDLSQMVYQLDEPQADLAPLNVGIIARAARAAGIKVLLSGAGGDDIFSGYRRHQSLRSSRFGPGCRSRRAARCRQSVAASPNSASDTPTSRQSLWTGASNAERADRELLLLDRSGAGGLVVCRRRAPRRRPSDTTRSSNVSRRLPATCRD